MARITFVVKTNPRHTSTGAHERFEIFREGRTVVECLARGVTHRDLRQALNNGWIDTDMPREAR